MKHKKGILFVISGPSGVGKGTVLKEVFNNENNLVFSVSSTTRSPREGEIEGRDYHFVTHDQFIKDIDACKFLEWAEVHGNHYGTSQDFVQKRLDAGIDVVLDIDVQGALIVMKNRPHSTFIFIAPPYMDKKVLWERLCNRKTEDLGQIEERVKSADEELKKACKYDYIVYNDIVEEATKNLVSIIRAERCRTVRHI
ncbi:MAG: guanylate kinase [Candidatus Eremiobacteraeota bacterium]|nr:guanylate kinase [Candidatus Eremiobacteraeota bacterium]